MSEEMLPQVLLTATGFAAREALVMLRKHNIATAPMLLRAGLSEHGLARTTDESNGQGVPQDDAEAVALWRNAVALWRKAADQGDADAQNALGEAYKHGRGVPQDDAQAVALWRKAADQGNASAQNNLGEAFAKGQGVPQDYVRAHMWFSLAVSGAPALDRDKIVKNRRCCGQDDARAERRGAADGARMATRDRGEYCGRQSREADSTGGIPGALHRSSGGVPGALHGPLGYAVLPVLPLHFSLRFRYPADWLRLYYSSRLIRHKPWAARVRFFGLVFLYGQEKFKPERKVAIYNWRRERALKLLNRNSMSSSASATRLGCRKSPDGKPWPARPSRPSGSRR